MAARVWYNPDCISFFNVVRSFLRKLPALDTLSPDLVLYIAGSIQLLVVDFELRGKSVKESQIHGSTTYLSLGGGASS